MKNIPHERRLTSSLCLMELVQGCLDKREMRDVKEFVRSNIAGVIHPDEKISEKAIRLLERHALSDGLRTVDSLIAATALTQGAALATSNYKHFKKISNLGIVKFEPE